jgi:hypothetical protein
MRSNNRRFGWIALAVLLLLVIGGAAFVVGLATGRGGVGNEMPMRGFGFGFRYPVLGLLAWLVPAILIGIGIGLVYALVRRPPPSAPPPPPPASPPAPLSPTTPAAPVTPDGGGVEALRELATMHTQGHLTDEEFAAAKRKLLGL